PLAPRSPSPPLRLRHVVSDLQEEGKNAINSPMSPALADVHPEDTQLEENEERTMIDPTSKEDPKFKELVKVLLDWINDVLVEERIIVKQLEEDLYDGQVLQKLLEKLAGCKLNVAEVTQSEIGQKQKLQTVLEAVHDLLRPRGWALRWSVDCEIGFISLRQKRGNVCGWVAQRDFERERDAFDTLFDHAPDKLSVVKKFVQSICQLLTLPGNITSRSLQFADGVYLVLLMGLLEDYFVPLHNFYLTPESFDQKVHNVSFAFELMLDGGLKKPKARPEDVVNLDLKSTLRVLYNLFTKYKNVE
uniref:Parvin beta n=1 Tax=Cercocebus atys TaxID=9531 RepID=A0A2K5MM19_CERAT